ncbi:hypothetical protein P700755_002832 [Psychroflexus torquis ATCC 700755]|uniref:Uncharacterized protein n=1 Tax=Psychroflexus torquis (strain ATCC 700755 / CIP 106069 / ACAM 623) TaxID=313595 RepID=K4IIB8_PSYTT|nr:hypothetical protein P700755_002832 [Psychroflexus torquis ATCC 700755]
MIVPNVIVEIVWKAIVLVLNVNATNAVVAKPNKG